MDGAPVYVVAFQDLLDLVVFGNITKPAVQLCKDNKLALSGLNIGEEPLKFGPFFCGFAGGYACVYISSNDVMPVVLRPLFQGGGLGCDG